MRGRRITAVMVVGCALFLGALARSGEPQVCPPTAANSSRSSAAVLPTALNGPPPTDSVRAMFEYNVGRRLGGPIYVDPARFSLKNVLGDSPQPILRVEATHSTTPGVSTKFRLFAKGADHELPIICTDTDLQTLAEHGTIQEIRLNGSRVTDVGLSALAKLPALAKLTVDSTSDITDAGMRGLAKCAKLTEVDLHHVKLTDDAGKALAKSAVTSLTIEKGAIAKGVLADLAKSETLLGLSLKSVKLEPGSLAPLAQVTKLARLTASSVELNDADFAAIGEMTSLCLLDLSSTKLHDEQMAGWDKLKTLSSVDFTNTYISAGGLATLRKIRTLTWISGDGLGISVAEQQRMADEYGWHFSGACSCGCLDIDPSKK